MRLGPVACLALACGAPAQGAKNPAAEDERCGRALGAVADGVGRALERRVQAAQSSEQAALALLELTPEQPAGQAIVREALAAQRLTREEFAGCLQGRPELVRDFEQRLRRRAESARARARALPALSDTGQGCRQLLPMLVSAKENQGLPIALAARIVLPCADKIEERELRCAIAEGNIAHFEACLRGERTP